MIKSSRPKVLWLFVLCCASMLSIAFFMNLTSVYLTSFSHAFGGVSGLTKEQLGRIPFFSFAGIIISILAVGALADRFGAKLFMVLGNLLVGSGMIALSLSPSYPVLLVSMFVIGLGSGGLDLILTPVIVSLFSDRKSSVLNWLHSFYPIGGIIIILVCGYGIQTGWNWRGVVAGLSAIPFLTTLALLLSRIPRVAPEEGKRQRVRDFLYHPVFFLLILGLLLAGIPEIGMNVWLPAYSELELKLPVWQANLGLILFTASMAFGRLLNGWLTRRIHIVWIMLAGSLGNALFYLLASLSPWPVAAWLACIGIGLAGASLWPGMLSLTSERFPRAGASIFAVITAVANVGGMLIPWSIGLGGDVFGLRPAMALVSIFPLLMIVLLFKLGIPKPEKSRTRG